MNGSKKRPHPKECGLMILNVRRGLLTEVECLHDCTIACDVLTLEVVEQTATLTYELHERTVGAIVLMVLFHVLSEVVDTISEEGNLALARTGVSGSTAILAENLLLFS